jgi:1,4-alpha-glucan branching enzyme
MDTNKRCTLRELKNTRETEKFIMATATKGKKRVTFKIDAKPGSTVAIAGDFNSWDPTKKRLTDKSGTGKFQGAVMVEKGRHEYKVVINDTWSVDPNCDDWAHNDFGSMNSVIVVD